MKVWLCCRQSSPAAYGIVYVSPVLMDCRGMLLLLCGRGRCVFVENLCGFGRTQRGVPSEPHYRGSGEGPNPHYRGVPRIVRHPHY